MSDEEYAGYTPIMEEEEIADFADANGFILTEVTDFLADDEAFAILGDNTPEDMAEFMKSHGIDSLFYEYQYIDESDAYAMPIVDDITEGMEPEMAEAVEKAFDAWNDEVDETDFSEPALLYFYAIYEGRVRCGTRTSSSTWRRTPSSRACATASAPWTWNPRRSDRPQRLRGSGVSNHFHFFRFHCAHAL